MQDYYDFLIDLALDMKDFEWVEELQESRAEYINNKNNKENQKTEKDTIVFTLEIKNMDEIEQMIEDLKYQLANLEIKFKQDEN